MTTPSQLSHIPGISHLGRLKEEVGYIYFLLKNGEVVYVGQTRNPVHSRVWHHQTYTGGRDRLIPGTRRREFVSDQKDFDDCWFFEVELHQLDTAEAHYIEYFKPHYNKTKPQVLRPIAKRVSKELGFLPA